MNQKLLVQIRDCMPIIKHFFFVIIIIVSCLSCKSRKITGKYYLDKTISSSVMVTEYLLLRKNHHFFFTREWDLGDFQAKGTWELNDSILTLRTEKSADQCFSIHESLSDKAIKDSTAIEIKMDKDPMPFAVIGISTPIDTSYFEYETNSEGRINLLLPNSFTMTVYYTPQILRNPIKYTFHEKKLDKIVVTFNESCIGKPFFKLPFILQGDSLIPIKQPDLVSFNKLYKEKH